MGSTSKDRQLGRRWFPCASPRLQNGVAQQFLTAREAHVASSGPSYAYARAAHQGADTLGDLLTRVAFGGAGTVVCTSGLVAVRCALQTALDGRDGEVMFARDIYHGSKDVLLGVAATTGFSSAASHDPLTALRAGKRPALVFIDSPSNWFLQCHDIGILATAAHDVDALLVVDVTLQPCQPALELGADMVVCSLSKDVALGHTLAGAIACREDSLLAQVEGKVRAYGGLVAPEVALTVHQQAVSLRDRLRAQAAKMAMITEALSDHPAIRGLNTAKTPLCGDLPGSQLALRLLDRGVAWRLERVVGQRSLDPSACLHLADTFGSAFTTVEHFASRRLGPPGETIGRPAIPVNAVRVGLGCEDGDQIAAELSFALDAALGATRPHPYPPRDGTASTPTTGFAAVVDRS